jgi:enoyl-CoA hydratase
MHSTIDSVFANGRALVIAGACGNVGFGKLGQFARLLATRRVPVIALDLAEAVQDLPARLREELAKKFDAAMIDRLLSNVHVVRGGIDAVDRPIGMVFEAIPERLTLKRDFYRQVRAVAADALIFSATSGFTTCKLFEGLPGAERCGVLHPFFPHLTNKLFELPHGGVTSPATQATIESLFAELGLIAVPVADVASFAADRVFCMMMTEAVRVHVDHGITPSVIDAVLLDELGARPFLVHNLITGANTLTVSCIDELASEVDSSFYAVPARFRELAENPTLRWDMGDRRAPTPAERQLVRTRVLGALFAVASHIIERKICSAADLNLMCEDALAFRMGLPALAQDLGLDTARSLVEQYLADQHTTHATEVACSAVWSAEHAEELQKLYITTARDGDCLLIQLGRAAINNVYVREFAAALDELESSGARCAVVLPDGRACQEFGRGADVACFVPALGDEVRARALSATWKEVFARLPRMAQPIVAALARRSLGGSNEVACLCHARIAARGTTIGQPEPTVGVVPGLGGCTTLLRWARPELRGEVARLLLTGDPIDAERALQLGLVSEVVSPDQLRERACALARALADGATAPAFERSAFELSIPDDIAMTTAAGVTLDHDHRALLQETLRGCAALAFEESMAYETLQAGRAFLLPAAAIGVKALLTGRKPEFKR